jgi:hypothetical protein
LYVDKVKSGDEVAGSFDPAFWEKGGAWAKIEVYFARYPK